MNILICEDHDITIDGINDNLKRSGIEYRLTGVNCGKDAKSHLSNNDCQLLILDISLSHKEGNHTRKEDGIEILKNIKSRWPELKVLMMSMHDENYMVRASFDNGAQGYLFKANASKELKTAIETVMKGQKYLSPDLQQKYERFCARHQGSLFDTLTKTEKNRAIQLVNDITQKEIAVMVHRSESTIRNQQASIFNKLGVNSIQELKEYLKFFKHF